MEHPPSSTRSPTSTSTVPTTSTGGSATRPRSYFNEKYGFWALFRYDDVCAAHKDWQTFSSAHGVDLSTLTTDPEIIKLTLRMII